MYLMKSSVTCASETSFTKSFRLLTSSRSKSRGPSKTRVLTVYELTAITAYYSPLFGFFEEGGGGDDFVGIARGVVVEFPRQSLDRRTREKLVDGEMVLIGVSADGGRVFDARKGDSVLRRRAKLDGLGDITLARVISPGGKSPVAEAVVVKREIAHAGVYILLRYLAFINFLIDGKAEASCRARHKLEDTQSPGRRDCCVRTAVLKKAHADSHIFGYAIFPGLLPDDFLVLLNDGKRSRISIARAYEADLLIYDLLGLLCGCISSEEYFRYRKRLAARNDFRDH